jgi:hypothetical protein
MRKFVRPYGGIYAKAVFPQTQKFGLLPKDESGKNWGDGTELTGQPFVVRGGGG